MISRTRSMLLALLFAGAFAFFTVEVRFANAAFFPDLEGFENDTDTWTPSDNDPLNDPNASGSPPAPFHDARDVSAGIIEEVPSGHSGVTASSGDFFGIIQSESGSAGYGFTAYQGTGNRLNSPWSFQTDLYVDPAKTAGAPYGNPGVPDFWWTNSVLDNGDNYVTETGLTATAKADDTWDFHTTGGTFIANVPTGQWVTMEVEYDYHNEHIQADHRVWSTDHMILYGSYHLSTMFQDPLTADIAGPGYTWLPYWDGVEYNFFDNIGVALRVGLGDLNNDGVTDFFDIEAFEIALVDPDAYIANWNAPEWEHRGDVNNDGVFDFFDIEQYEVLLVGGIPTNALSAGGAGGGAVPEPSSVVLLGLGGIGLALGARRRLRKNFVK